MKPVYFAFLFIAGLLSGEQSLSAQTPAPSEERLARWLRRFPDADTDKDGRLSPQEAQDYIGAHPELRAVIDARKDTSGPSNTDKASSQVALAARDAVASGAGLRVFVCAHSYMNFTATMLPPITAAAGLEQQDAGRQMLGGSRVIQHWNLPDEKNLAKAALLEGHVDVLLLSPHLQLPDEGIDNFTRLGLEKNPQLRVLVQASWPPHDGKRGRDFKNAQRDAVTAEEVREQRDYQRNGWLKKLEGQVDALNAAIGREVICVVPVSEAVFALRERVAAGQVPGVSKQSDLFKDDHGHPATVLSLLVTYCHFTAIHQRSPVGLPVPALLQGMPQAEELNRLLQQLAWDAVSTYRLSGVKAGGKP